MQTTVEHEEENKKRKAGERERERAKATKPKSTHSSEDKKKGPKSSAIPAFPRHTGTSGGATTNPNPVFYFCPRNITPATRGREPGSTSHQHKRNATQSSNYNCNNAGPGAGAGAEEERKKERQKEREREAGGASSSAAAAHPLATAPATLPQLSQPFWRQPRGNLLLRHHVTLHGGRGGEREQASQHPGR